MTHVFICNQISLNYCVIGVWTFVISFWLLQSREYTKISSSTVIKRHCVGITSSQKLDLCLFKEQNARATQVDILAYLYKEWSGFQTLQQRVWFDVLTGSIIWHNETEAIKLAWLDISSLTLTRWYEGCLPCVQQLVTDISLLHFTNY